MKNLLITLIIFFFPLLAAAYDFQQQYADTSNQLTDVITTHAPANYNNQYKNSNGDLYKQVINVLNKHKAVNHNFLATPSNDGTTSNFACYLVDDIKKELQSEGLAEQLQNDEHTLNEVANHIVGFGYDNKYETLLAVGVSPIEAGLRLGHDKNHKYGKYIDEALTQGQITYEHYEPQSSTVALITNEVIYITVTEAEVEAVQKHLTDLNAMHRPKWMQEFIKELKHEVKQETKELFEYF